MAEAAGLAFGGVGLVALLDTAMSTFDKIDAAKSYGKDYQKLALKAYFLRLRLSRWAEALQLVDKAADEPCYYNPAGVPLDDQSKQVGAPATGGPLNETEYDNVRQLLGQIGSDIERTKRYAERYDQIKTGGQVTTQDQRELDMIDKLISKVNSLALKRQKGTSISRKALWAVRDGGKFRNLLEQIDESLTDLEKIFPDATKAKQRQVRDELVKTDAEELVRPSGIEEPADDGQATMAVLAEATTGVDALLQEAIKKAVPGDDLKNRFESEVVMIENVRLSQGLEVMSGYVGPTNVGRTSVFSGSMKGSGNARIFQGEYYGSKRVFDD
ncbi:uncharacterized protein LTR77_000053 [Saxophila tyrrhenica]|uniref:Prion-inhibition and propagation HeLo domain-containing protein n=1 Tax=Saxophila tyrrhenica TaxID=1690608 RepID=A0AAV9PM61_9PEZI|nr:hypothetical protein LTR77_000053 [Saxophila tyrrhenica]